MVIAHKLNFQGCCKYIKNLTTAVAIIETVWNYSSLEERKQVLILYTPSATVRVVFYGVRPSQICRWKSISSNIIIMIIINTYTRNTDVKNVADDWYWHAVRLLLPTQFSVCAMIDGFIFKPPIVDESKKCRTLTAHHGIRENRMGPMI